MKIPETIIVRYVHDHIGTDKDNKYTVAFAGVSDKPSKLMELQTWVMPHSTSEEAKKTLAEYQDKIKKGPFIICLMK